MNEAMIGTLHADGSYDRRPTVNVNGRPVTNKVYATTLRLDATHYVVIPQGYKITDERTAALKTLIGSGRGSKASAKASEDN